MKTMMALLLGLAAAGNLAARDTLKFKDPKKNSDVEGDVIHLAYDLIEIEVLVGGAKVKQSVDPRLVKEILPRKNFDFLKGEQALENGDAPDAILRFERVVENMRTTPVLRQQAALMILRTQFSGGKYPEAVQAAQSLRARTPDGYYVGESLVLEVKALLAMKNPDGAGAAIATLAALGKARTFLDWVKNADLLDAGRAELQKNWRAALQTYRKFARDAELGEEAARGELRCLTAIPDLPALGARADEIIQDAQGKETFPSRLLIAAYTGKADVDQQAGKLKAALFGYLQGSLALAKGERSPEHETSVARSALACLRVAAGSERREKEVYRGRALDLLEDLKKAYPGSRYVAEIEEALRRLR
jgi:hypothetical protein